MSDLQTSGPGTVPDEPGSECAHSRPSLYGIPNNLSSVATHCCTLEEAEDACCTEDGLMPRGEAAYRT